MALYYKDYLEIDHDFIPVFSDEIDKREPTRWKYFVPHQSMRNVLTAVIKALEGANSADPKPIWLTGSYGTGKTFASFVIKHVLEDDMDEVKEYFDKYALIKPLYDRLKAIRQNRKMLVVYRSGSGNIVNSERLLIEVQQSIQKALTNAGYNYMGGKTAVQSILSKLTDPNTTFNFERAFDKYRLDFGEYATPQQVIDTLCNTDNYDLVERVARVMEKEGFAYFQNVDDVKVWIDDVIKGNGLGSIWFIWDEFTDYFRQNRAVSTLQELAHASGKMPFYLFLITHRNIDQFALDEDARKVLRNRFTNIRFEMSNVTSYQLMANAINIKESRKEEWEIKLITLWDEVKSCVRELKACTDNVEMEKLDEKNLKMLVPIHPFSAYLISVISRRLSSNQRTMFQFLEENPAQEGENEKYNFHWFIQTHSLDGWHWLTADILWDYFFKDVAVDNPDYSSEVYQVINYYNANYGRIPEGKEDELRVFKSAMLLVALNRVLGSTTLLRPLQSNIGLIFNGTPIYGKIRDILNELHGLGLLNFNVISSDERELVIPLISYDEGKLNNIKKNLEIAYSFDKCAESDNILGGALLDSFTLSGPLAIRFEPRTTSLKNLKRNLERFEADLQPYQIGLLFIIPHSDDELARIDEVMKENADNDSRVIMVAIEQPFSERDLDNWLSAKAREEYSRELGDNSNAKYYEDQAKGYISRWLTKVKVSSLNTCFISECVKVDKLDALDNYLEKVSSKVYPYGPERLTANEPLYKTTGYAESAILMGMNQKAANNPYENIKSVLVKEGFWDNDSMYEAKRDHPVSKMKQKIKEKMDTKTSVYLMEIWKELMEPPFGLAPSPIAAFLFGFLMKEYANGSYYKDDGINATPLSYEGLANAINSVLKPNGNRNSERIAISRMKPEHEYFCRIMSAAFGITGDMPKTIKQNIRHYSNEKRYPLWALKYYILYSGKYDNNERLKEMLLSVVETLCEFVSSKDEDDTLSLVDDIVKQLKSYPKADVSFESIIDGPAFKEGMKFYLEKNNPNIIEFAQKANIDFARLLDRIRNMMADDAHWLWDEEKLNSEIAHLEDEYRLINALNAFVGITKSDLGEISAYIRDEKLNKLKIPTFVIEDYLGGECGKAWNMLVNFARSDWYSFADKTELAGLIEEYGSYIKDKLSNPYNIFADYLKNHMGINMDNGNVRELFDRLPAENYPNAQAFESKINELIHKLETVRLMNTLNETWQRISGCPSPRQWSQDKHIPISCLPGMDNPDLWNTFEIINVGRAYSKADIEKAISVLHDNEGLLSILNNEDSANKAFIQAIAGDYAYLILDGIGIDVIKEKLKQRFGNDIYSWGKKKSEIQRFVQNYAADYYKQRAYIKVLEKIDVLTAELAKEYLKELIRNEPLVGIKILTSTNEG